MVLNNISRMRIISNSKIPMKERIKNVVFLISSSQPMFSEHLKMFLFYFRKYLLGCKFISLCSNLKVLFILACSVRSSYPGDEDKFFYHIPMK